MIYRFQYTDEASREQIISLNQDKRIIEEQNIIDGNFLIFTDEKPSVTVVDERLELLEQERLFLQIALAESIEKQEVDKINNQIALAEVIETLTIKGVL
ncbi:hypothetical protein OR571_13130 [Psychrobacillus sp. NEAU-3TGS]|uniref:hypothetical protein n=1 Tax=Psychrobacillus sp. NEAU-3TGS TaxID=2995412 RepID=UPI0024990414|nr:hypothetical protein [Psychrobacillus sp. NEAU-3TGS]MDI2588031.1 hypothetical protein [Psychrobacillus sp. NEAU-3TGS]